MQDFLRLTISDDLAVALLQHILPQLVVVDRMMYCLKIRLNDGGVAAYPLDPGCQNLTYVTRAKPLNRFDVR